MLESPRIFARSWPLRPVPQQQPSFPQQQPLQTTEAPWEIAPPLSPFEEAARKPDPAFAALEGMAASPTTPLCCMMTHSESVWPEQCSPPRDADCLDKDCAALKPQLETPLTPCYPDERRSSLDAAMPVLAKSKIPTDAAENLKVP